MFGLKVAAFSGAWFLLFFIFIHFYSHTLAHSFSGRSVQWTSVLWQVCMPITPETASSTSETGSLPGFRPCCRYTHTLALIQARTFPPTRPHAHHLCAKVGCEKSLLISIIFILNTCFLRKRRWTTILTLQQEHRLVCLIKALFVWLVLTMWPYVPHSAFVICLSVSVSSYNLSVSVLKSSLLPISLFISTAQWNKIAFTVMKA